MYDAYVQYTRSLCIIVVAQPKLVSIHEIGGVYYYKDSILSSWVRTTVSLKLGTIWLSGYCFTSLSLASATSDHLTYVL